MFKQLLMVSTAVVGLAFAATAPAEAAQRGRSVSVQGSNGAGYVASRSISREQGSAAASRSVQTNSGAGATTSRGATWANGNYSGGATHSLNNGATFGRSTTATNNGDGTANYSTTFTAPSGSTTSVSGVVTRTPQ